MVQDLHAGQLLELVDEVWGWEDTTQHKPDPLVLAAPLERLADEGIDVRYTRYVGDAIADLVVACHYSIGFIAVLTGVTDKNDFVKQGLAYDRIFTTLRELASLP